MGYKIKSIPFVFRDIAVTAFAVVEKVMKVLTVINLAFNVDDRPYHRGQYLISSDGYLMHGVVDRLQQLQHGVQSLLEFTAVSLLRTVFQQLLSRARDTG